MIRPAKAVSTNTNGAPTSRLLTIGALSILGIAGVSMPQDQATPASKAERQLGCDHSSIHWLIPGEFDAARKRAQKESRLLIIKGISFGVDDVGASCATKGKW